MPKHPLDLSEGTFSNVLGPPPTREQFLASLRATTERIRTDFPHAFERHPPIPSWYNAKRFRYLSHRWFTRWNLSWQNVSHGHALPTTPVVRLPPTR